MYLHCLGAGSEGVNIWHRSSDLLQMLALHKNGGVKKAASRTHVCQSQNHADNGGVDHAPCW